MFTTADAFIKVSHARIGSLDPDRINYDYLLKLRKELYVWIEKVDQAIGHLTPKSEEPEIEDDSNKICDCGDLDCIRPFNHVLEP